MNRNIVLNLIFIALFIVFLVLSLLIDYFFFIPIICLLPFSFSTIRNKDKVYEKGTPQTSSYNRTKYEEVRYCQKCGGEITEPKAQFCYHCGEKLNIK
ncbi:MAG: hypothetical protein R3255_03265 [Candidatus Lokiarchaeia archaeon]|nr:hypothetical protein [Candidatus Lokiarchaeia archaeon]